MATSGSVNFNVNALEVITEAVELAGVKDFDTSLDGGQLLSCARTLNMMIKYWQTKNIMMWKMRDVYLFLSPSTQYYDLGPSGDHATLSMVKTEVAADASSGATSFTVDSITGISDNDYIGIELDDGTLQWSTVNGSPSGSTITIDDALTDDISEDANVYAYTTIINRPLLITDGLFNYDDGTRIPIDIISRNEYKSLATPSITGKCNKAWYDPQRTNGRIYVWPTADSVKDYLILTAKMPVEDIDATQNDFDFPQEWFLPLAFNLAVLISPKFNREVSQSVAAQAIVMLNDITYFDADSGSVIFNCDE